MIFPDGTEFKRHDSIRGWFAYQLYLEMATNKDIYLLVGDLGYKIFDQHFKDFPDRCINTGAAEQALIDIGIGLSLEGKIPVCYSITPFLIYRPFESLRTYINHENIPIILAGSGHDKDYEIDGFSHDASDIKPFLDLLPNIQQAYPDSKEQIPSILQTMIQSKRPCFLSLKR